MNTLHLRIRASAGTGKTFRLTDRIVELLLLGAEPGKIIALTFTRKAAGEFLVKTLRKLAGLASSGEEVAAFCARRGIARELGPQDFLPLLRKLAGSLDQIEFGTLDSFFYRVVAAFGAPLGLGASPRLLDETSSARAEREILRHVAEGLSPLDLVAELVRGPARARLNPLAPDLDLLDRIESLYALHPEASAWGNETAIWGPAGCPWKKHEPPEDLSACSPRIAEAITQLNALRPGSGRLGIVAEQLLAAGDALRAGNPVAVEYRNKEILLNPPECALALQAVGACLWRILAPRLVQARRWLQMALALRAARDQRLVDEGTLRFADLPVLLSRITKSEPDAGELQFRLDGWFDHWLLDEFQDTSRIQWRAIQPLLDEVLQDSSGARSFFYVGDVKQSIYGFRDGDPTLFGEIFDHYTRHAPDHIGEESLGESRRSSKEVIDLVGRTFAPDSLTSAGMPGQVVERWRRAWTAHTAHESNPAPGFVHQIFCDQGDCWARISEIVRDSAILDRPPLTIAVLVKTNDQAREAVGELGRLGIPATTESNPHIAADNPHGVAILMAARLVADPSDDFARNALGQFSVFSDSVFGEAGPELNTENQRESASSHGGGQMFGSGSATEAKAEKNRTLKTSPKFTEDALELFHLRGAHGMVHAWLKKLPVTPRHAALRRAAREFDDNMQGSPREFAEFLAGYADPTSARPGTVQIMTIHKSKGLEFDLVFLPLPKDTRMDKRHSDSPYCSEDEPAWILQLPAENLCAADPVLRAAGQRLRESAAFDNLCGLYVAETRARRALVILSQPIKEPKG
ncbi:MAG: UvrD-helicase domain-containing protein [Terrimicrobiaceae bacterium]|nr:UvrD-helicase domain-containing protein [Terrimicrobiaceae bacterium]